MSGSLSNIEAKKIYTDDNENLETVSNDHKKDEESSVASKVSFKDRMIQLFQCIVKEVKLSFVLYIICVLYLSISVLNKVFMKRTMQKTNNYGFVILQTQIFVSTIVYTLVYLIQFFFFKRTMDTSKKTPVRMFIYISICDSLMFIITFIGIINTAGTIQSFIIQLSIPVNMFFCFIIFKYKYNALNYIGAAIIVVVIAAMEILLAFKEQEENSIVFNLIYMTSLIPMSFSNILREKTFSLYNTNIFLMMLVVGIIQFCITFLMLPLYSLPLLTQGRIPLNELGDNIKAGLKCLFLKTNTIVENCGKQEKRLCDNCEGAWIIYGMYSFFNILDNLISCFIIESFTALTYTILSCVQGPAITIAYYFRFIAGDAVREPRVADFIILAGYFIGTVIYRTGNIIRENQKLKEKDEALSDEEEKETRVGDEEANVTEELGQENKLKYRSGSKVGIGVELELGGEEDGEVSKGKEKTGEVKKGLVKRGEAKKVANKKVESKKGEDKKGEGKKNENNEP